MTDMTKLGAHSPDEEAERLSAVEKVYAGKSETPRMTSAPKVIYLQYSAHENDYLKDYSDGITWCADKENSDDVEYIRADIHEALEKEAERLREALTAMLDDELIVKHAEFCHGTRCPFTLARALLSPAPTERADK